MRAADGEGVGHKGELDYVLKSEYFEHKDNGDYALTKIIKRIKALKNK